MKRKMSPEQAAGLLCNLLDVPVSTWMARKMLREGQLPGEKPRGRWHVRESDVRRFAETRLKGGDL